MTLYLVAVPGFDGFYGVVKCAFQNALADCLQHETKYPSLEVLALAYDDHVNIGFAIRRTCEGVSVAGRASPHIGVSCCKDDAARVGPVVIQTFPDAHRAFGDVGLRRADMMHLQGFI